MLDDGDDEGQIQRGRDGCYIAGCNQTVCSSDPGALSTCDWQWQYACFDYAVCEKQRSGECGWTSTPRYEQCVATSVQ